MAMHRSETLRFFARRVFRLMARAARIAFPLAQWHFDALLANHGDGIAGDFHPSSVPRKVFLN